MARRCNSKGLSRIEVVAALLVTVFVLSVLPPTLRHAKSDATRVVCGANLATIGKAMLLYANDYRGEFPRAGGRVTTWGPLRQWDAPDRSRAFGLAPDGSGGEATISSCFYLLVKYAGLEPKQFVCPGDQGATEFKLSEGPDRQEGLTLTDAWDFGLEADKHCSYAYQLPFGLFALKTTHDPGKAVAADRSPWLRSLDKYPKSLANFKPDLPPFKGTPEQARVGNSIVHGEDGQNVLFLDGHAAFKERSYCGLDDDNIYLVSNDPAKGSPIGIVPAFPFATPANWRDSILVHDPPMHRVSTITQEAREIDSKSFQRTAIVATLECPLPEHKNAIWCSTFQMAWDNFGQDVIREPIQLDGAEDLADRLNHSDYPAGDIEAKSYYGAAGFVKDGIIEQIQKEVKRRFPSEPVPIFSSAYRTLPDAMLAYAYLNVDVAFEYPYYTYLGAFDFQDSDGSRTGVTAFRAQTSVHSGGVGRLRDQVEVLYYDYGQSPGTAQFAVDLCKQTQPYQVVLARVPRSNTLGEAARALQEKIGEFKNDSDYEVLRKLRPIDTLIVPDVLFKVTHCFDELLGKHLENPKWRGSFIFEAMQKIDFALSRTGVVLKSEARLGAAAARPARQIAQPRHLHFDRPFLICVKKREANATPFFVMWVDNAELMQPHENSGKGR